MHGKREREREREVERGQEKQECVRERKGGLERHRTRGNGTACIRAKERKGMGKEETKGVPGVGFN